MDALKEKEDFDIIDFNDIFGEDMELEYSRYHSHNSIYLYICVERETANKFVINNTVSVPILAYETPNIALAMKQNISSPVVLRIAVRTTQDRGEYCYDKFTMPDEIIKSKFKSIDEYTKMCTYERKPAKINKMSIVEYKINTPHIISSIQYAQNI